MSAACDVAPRVEQTAPRHPPGVESSSASGAHNLGKTELDALAELGRCHLLAGDLLRARVLFEGLRALDPLEPHYLLGLGLVLDHAEDRAGAGDAYRLAARLSPDDARPEVNLAELAIEAGDRISAQALLISAKKKATTAHDLRLADKCEGLLSKLEHSPQKNLGRSR